MSLKPFTQPTVIPYIPACWPSPEGSLAIAKGLAKAGCRTLELGFPFSDPVADGPTIQAASQHVLEQGYKVSHFFDCATTINQNTELELIVMTYTNLLHKPGYAQFCHRAHQAGIQGLIIPDLPLDESTELQQVSQEHDIDLIQLCTPVTEPQRARQIAHTSRGFIYMVSVLGVTGSRTSMGTSWQEQVRRLKKETDTPVFLGFGISQPHHVAEAIKTADGVIVGSALIRHLSEIEPAHLEEEAYLFMQELLKPTEMEPSL